jgi:hypothetical protein
MANGHNVNDMLSVTDFINDAVIANANPPQILGADQLSRPWRTRVEGESFNPCHDASD